MAQIKCKMCGGSIEVELNEQVVECEYCGTKQTIPTLNNEKLVTLHNRANTLRMKNDFAKAMLTYENIIEEAPNDAEAHWCLLLCRYGIEYVDDPKTGKKIPTCHRTQYKSIFDDIDYKAAIENSDVLARKLYQEEAEEINRIQKNILAISQKEEPYDIFICYKESDNSGKRTRDSVIAQEIYDTLIKKEYKVFFAKITLESKLGTQYEPHIFAALNSAKLMLVLGTRPEYFTAPWVKNEWSRYISIMEESGGKKYLIPCYRDMDAYELPDELVTFQCQDMNKLGFIQDLTRGIDKIFGRVEKKKVQEVKPNVVNGVNIGALLKRSEMLINDHNYDKANELIDNVLNNDPENARAYALLLVIDLGLSAIEDLGSYTNVIDDNINYKYALSFADEAFHNELESYSERINENIESARKQEIYNKALVAKKNGIYEEAANIFNSIIGFNNAKEQALECNRLAQDVIYNRAKMNLNNKHYEKAIEDFKKIESYKDSLELIDLCNDLIYKEKEKIYNQAISYMNEYSFTLALNLFNQIIDFKDSKDLIEKCKELGRKEVTYHEIIEEAKVSNSISVYNSAIKRLETLRGYRDSESLIDNYKKKIEQIKKEQAIRKDKFIRGVKIGTPIVAFIITLIILIVTVFIPLGNYNKGMEYFDEGNLNEATEFFIQADGFKDSGNQLQLIKSIRYLQAGDLENGVQLLYSNNCTITVQYDANSGVISQDELLIDSSSALSLFFQIKPVKSGYSFMGYEIVDYKVNNKKDNYSAVIKLKAIWSGITYNITYDSSYIDYPSDLPYSYTSGDGVSIPNLEERGYTFTGWKVNDGEVIKDLVISKTEYGNIKLCPVFEANKYVVTLYYDNNNIQEIIATYDEILTLPIATKEGYTFHGWLKDEEIIEDEFIWKYDSEIILTAKYTINSYIIKFNTNGGSKINSIDVEYGASLEDITIDSPTHKYGNFIGWDQELPETMPANNITLTAIWEVLQPAIIFETNGGEKIEDMLLNFGDSVNVADPFREGYTFNGWTPELPSVMPEEIIYVKANWIANSYSVTLDVNGGNELEESLLTVTYDSPYALPTPTYSNFMLQFVGWYDGDELITDGIWKGLNSVTLTAKWNPKTYTENGKTYVNLGRYPQTVVSDSDLISNLNNITTTNSLGYIEYLGAEYKKVTVGYIQSDYTFINGNSIKNDSTYYFKVEPIKWRVLQNTNGTYKLLSEYILDNMYYYVNKNIREVSGKIVYANNYMYSNVRAWLNGLNGSSYNVSNYTGKGFLDIAFTEAERNFINTTLVDNSASTTSNPSNSFTCSDTNDKVYLLSYYDMFNTSFGFNSNSSTSDTRKATVSDYARSKGCLMSTSSDSYGKGYWLLRSPHYYFDYYAGLVNDDGHVNDLGHVNYSRNGVRPALEITI